MKRTLKRLSAKLPVSVQQRAKQLYFSAQIRANRFLTDEPEYSILDKLIMPGDWALDIGANIGHYTYRLSSIVGPHGRVVAFEPLRETFELLAANMALAPYANVTLVNAAASSSTCIKHMQIPYFDVGLRNYYMAHITDESAGVPVLCLPIDSFAIPNKVRLAKVDAEGHENEVLEGMMHLVRSSRPLLIIEDSNNSVFERLAPIRYRRLRLPGSSNLLYAPDDGVARQLQKLGAIPDSGLTAPSTY